MLPLIAKQCNGWALTQREGAIFSVLVHEDKRPLRAHSKLCTAQSQCITIHQANALGFLRRKQFSVRKTDPRRLFVVSKSEQEGGWRHFRGTFFHEEGFLTKWKKKYCRRCWPPFLQRDKSVRHCYLNGYLGKDGEGSNKTKRQNVLLCILCPNLPRGA